VELLEVKLGSLRVAAFDGRVLELFGGSVRRFHIQLLTVAVTRPDRKGNRTVKLQQSQTEDDVFLGEADYTTFQPLLDALQAAGVSVSVDA